MGRPATGLRMPAFARKRGPSDGSLRRETDDGVAGLARGEEQASRGQSVSPAFDAAEN